MIPIQELIGLFNDSHPVMRDNNKDPQQQKTHLLDEVYEAFAVIGDPEKLGTELADIVWFCYTMAILNGLNLDDEIREKAARNYLKYPPGMFQEGDYNEARAKARKQWLDQNGEEWFYNIPRTSNPPSIENEK